MRDNFSAYPSTRIWGLTKPDSNIDHRRVPNLQTFLKRHGTMLPITNNADIYKAGDIVTWMLPGNLPHIGIVVDTYAADNKTPLIVHNIGAGPQREDYGSGSAMENLDISLEAVNLLNEAMLLPDFAT